MLRLVENSSEGNSRGDLRAVHDGVKEKAVVLVVYAECPVTDLGEDGTGEVDTDYALDLPHQVGTNSEASDFTAHSSVVRLVKVVAATQADIGIEKIIVF